MNIKKLKVYTLLIHCFIVIGAGHGIGVMGIFDIVGILQIPEILKNGISFDFYGGFQDRLSLVTVFSLFGKFFLILSLFLKNNLSENINAFFGLLFLWISVYLLTSGNWDYDSLYEIAFWTSIPFLISSLFLTYSIAKKFNRNKQSL
jgi:hypothetical protein